MVAVRAATTAAYKHGDDDASGAGQTEESSSSTQDSVVALDVPTVGLCCPTVNLSACATCG